LPQHHAQSKRRCLHGLQKSMRGKIGCFRTKKQVEG
jgi:hypothetical protein